MFPDKASTASTTTVHVSPNVAPPPLGLATDEQLQFGAFPADGNGHLVATGVPVGVAPFPPSHDPYYHASPPLRPPVAVVDPIRGMNPAQAFQQKAPQNVTVRQAAGCVDAEGQPMLVITKHQPGRDCLQWFFILLALFFIGGSAALVYFFNQWWRLAFLPFLIPLFLVMAWCHGGLMGVVVTIRPEGYIPPDTDNSTKQMIHQKVEGTASASPSPSSQGVTVTSGRYVVDVTYRRLIDCIGASCCLNATYRHVNIPIADITQVILAAVPGKPGRCMMYFERQSNALDLIIIGGNPNRGCCALDNEQAKQECNFWAYVMQSLQGSRTPVFTQQDGCCLKWFIGCC